MFISEYEDLTGGNKDVWIKAVFSPMSEYSRNVNLSDAETIFTVHLSQVPCVPGLVTMPVCTPGPVI